MHSRNTQSQVRRLVAGFAAAAAALAFSAGSRAAVINDFAADFSTAAATSGPWSYGWSTTLGSSFNLDSNRVLYGSTGSVVAWSPGGTFWPTTALNTGATGIDFGGGNAVHLDPGQGLLHPGANGEYAVVLLTVSSAMDALLETQFSGADRVPTTTDVHVLLNGVALFDAVISSFGQPVNFNAVRHFNAGDVISFAVGPGGNGYVDDSTGFYARLSTINSVPEPSSMVLSASSLMALAAVHLLTLRRRQAVNRARG